MNSLHLEATEMSELQDYTCHSSTVDCRMKSECVSVSVTSVVFKHAEVYIFRSFICPSGYLIDPDY
jgi:hypothetical protein